MNDSSTMKQYPMAAKDPRPTRQVPLYAAGRRMAHQAAIRVGAAQWWVNGYPGGNRCPHARRSDARG
jgi:hypothetical protein